MIVCNNVKPNNMTFPFVIKACTVLFRVKFGILVHNYVSKYGLECDLYVRSVLRNCCLTDVVSWNSVINGYGVVGSLDEAKKLFDQMPERNVVSWNSMLDGYVKCGCVEDAVKMFRHMPRSDVVSWNAMLACYAVTL
ncbi:putative tetratricopeptide-like helical domain superfamily [Helianthus annuus]|nr:putative tetratricopeptide-like helical domain superfamily [Helianthus annuus]